jgi:hypothetical protein
MALSKKGLQTLTLSAHTYRWIIFDNKKHISIHIIKENMAKHPLCFTIPHPLSQGKSNAIITPQIIRTVIMTSKRQDWNPNKKISYFQLCHSNKDQIYAEIHKYSSKIKRQDAKYILAQNQSRLLSLSEKKELLNHQIWDMIYFPVTGKIQYDQMIKEQFPRLDHKALRFIIHHNELPNPIPSSFEDLLIYYYMFKLNRVVNQYIEVHLQKFGLFYHVTGEIELSKVCPCCLYNSLGVAKNPYEICPVCFWSIEIPKQEKYIHNGQIVYFPLDLETAQRNFLIYGACTADDVQHVDPAGKEKYTN